MIERSGDSPTRKAPFLNCSVSRTSFIHRRWSIRFLPLSLLWSSGRTRSIIMSFVTDEARLFHLKDNRKRCHRYVWVHVAMLIFIRQRIMTLLIHIAFCLLSHLTSVTRSLITNTLRTVLSGVHCYAIRHLTQFIRFFFFSSRRCCVSSCGQCITWWDWGRKGWTTDNYVSIRCPM